MEITLNFDEDTMKLITQVAKQQGVTIEEFMRKAIMERLK